MAFIEYAYTARVPQWRINRFYAASSLVDIPLDMVDSGFRTSGRLARDTTAYYNVYKQMIEATINRPPLAALSGVTRRAGNNVEFRIDVTNQSTVTLATAVNAPAVHGIVYEENHFITTTALTSRFGRLAGYATVDQPLAPGDSRTYPVVAVPLVSASALGTFDWSKMHSVALLDDRPQGLVAGYDMLQAARLPSPLLPSQTALQFAVGKDQQAPPAQPLTFGGTAYTQWSVTAPPWLVVTPSSGTTNQTLDVTVLPDALAFGMQQGTLLFSATDAQGLAWSAWVDIAAARQAPYQYFLPASFR